MDWPGSRGCCTANQKQQFIACRSASLELPYVRL